MKAVESSLTYRSADAALRWAGRCAASSLSGRAVAWAALRLRPALADSLSLGTRRIRSVRLESPSVSPAAAAFTKPAFVVQEAIAHGAAGRGLRGLGLAAPLSGFVQGNWVRVLGAAALGLGCGMIPSRTAVGSLLLVIGLVLVAAGPLVRDAMAQSRVARLFGRLPAAGPVAVGQAGVQDGHPPRWLFGIRGVTWAAMLLALAAGVLAGVGPAARVVVAVAVVVAAAGAVLWRPQIILLVVAAFPWVDWVARNTLGGLGPLWDDALLVVGVALVLWSVLVLRRDVPRSVPIALPVLLMVGAAVGSIVVNRVPGGPAVYGLRVIFQPILFYFVAFLIPMDRRWVRWVTGVFIATTTLLALHGLYQYVTHVPTPPSWVDASETGISTRAFSVLGNPNLLGGMLVIGTLVTAGLVLSRALSGARRLTAVAACLVQLGGLAVTFSRGAWIGFGVGLVVMMVLAYRRYFVGMLVAAGAAWFVVPQVFTQRLLFSFSSAYTTKSATGLGRLWRWENALQHIADKPLLGTGLGTFGGTTAALFGYWSIWVDNFYLQIAAEGGLLLLASFLWLTWRNLKGLVRARSLTADPYLKALAAGVFGAVVALIVANFFEADWEGLSVAVAFWSLSGLVTSAVITGQGAGVSSAGTPPRRGEAKQ